MKHLTIAVTLAFGTAGAASAGTIADVYTSFYAFGDSLSDDGKFGALDPPSLEGRFSNGKVWAEVIADRFEAAGADTGNLAQGGAVTGSDIADPAGPLATFGGQIATFAGALATGTGLPTQVLPTPEFAPAPPSPGDNPLVSVFFGANDFFQGGDMGAAADSVAAGIRAIRDLGANFDDFLVLSLPDIGQTPAFAGSGAAAATAASHAFNARLAGNVAGLRAEGLTVIEVDTQSAFQEILDDIATETFEFGILDATTPCTQDIGAPLDPEVSNPGNCVANGIDPDTLLFADAVHPNRVAHRLLAEEAIAAVENRIAAVPLPAALPMLVLALGGLGGVGGVARRRRVRGAAAR